MEELHINKPRKAIEIHNNIPLAQRKIFNCLMLRALLSGELRKGGYYKITVKELMHLTGNKQKDFLQLDKQVSEMQTTLIQWAGTKEGDFGRVQFLGEVEYKDGVLEYFFSQKLIRMVKSNPQFGRLNMGAVRAMESKYSLALYEWACLYKDYSKGTGFRVLDDLKLILCGDTEMYPEYKDFNRYVIKSAIKEVNEKTDINIHTKIQKKGRSVNAICFYVGTKKEFSAMLERPLIEEAKTKLQLKGNTPKVEQVPEEKLLDEMNTSNNPELLEMLMGPEKFATLQKERIERERAEQEGQTISPEEEARIEAIIKEQEQAEEWRKQMLEDEREIEIRLEEFYAKHRHYPGQGPKKD